MYDTDFPNDEPDCDGPPCRSRYRAMSPPGTWKDGSGKVLRFGEMEHRHLLNTIAFVERKYRELQDSFCDGALDINLLYPEHAGLVAEAKRRGLIPRTAGKDGMVTR